MNLTAPSEVKALLDKLGVRPNKTLGQNFLIDANILKILLATASLRQSDAVLEVGPGLGVLTEWLARWSGRVVAVEKDRKLFRYLRDRFAETPNVELIEGDVLDLDLDRLLTHGINKVVSNLPYAVGSRFLVELLLAQHAPEQIVVTLQLEVARRLAAEPGGNDYGLISVLAQSRYKVEIRKEVKRTCFLPPPDVKSAMVNMLLLTQPREEPRDRGHLCETLKKAFSHRRKQLAPILQRILPKESAADIERLLRSLEIDPRARPENLTPADWIRLSNALYSFR